MMIAMIAMLGTMMVHAPPSEDDIFYEEVIFEALTDCKNFATTDEKRIQNTEKMLWKIVEIERRFHVPDSLRGMLLSAACAESGYNPLAKGDWITRMHRGRKRKTARAHGLYQMWPWWIRAYKINRTDPIQTSDAFMKHIEKQLKRIKCKFRSPRRRWIAAWVTAIRAPKRGGRCHEKPKHLRILKKWHKSIKRARSMPGC
jgi:hypothetical protein